MQRATALRLSTQILRLASNLHTLKDYRNWNSGMEVRCIGQNCSNFSTGLVRVSNGDYDRIVQDQCDSRAIALSEVPQDIQSTDRYSKSAGSLRNCQIGENVANKDKMKFLVNTLFDLKDSKEAVYGALDAWVAWEQNFPLVSLKRALRALEKEEQWHRVIQVIKWMLSKGQGTTMGTYEQLIRALDKDRRAEEAHEFWVKKIGHDLHSVPWQFCNLMISIYYRNNMLERLVKLFKGLEAFDRKPPDKFIVQKVAAAYEMLGSLEEKNKVLEKYSYLFNDFTKISLKTKKKGEKLKKERTETAHDQILETSLNAK